MISTEEITKRLSAEIAVITGISAETITRNTTLASCGINSMGFVEILVAAKRIWNIDLIESGLVSADVANIGALADRIADEIRKNA